MLTATRAVVRGSFDSMSRTGLVRRSPLKRRPSSIAQRPHYWSDTQASRGEAAVEAGPANETLVTGGGGGGGVGGGGNGWPG